MHRTKEAIISEEETVTLQGHYSERLAQPYLRTATAYQKTIRWKNSYGSDYRGLGDRARWVSSHYNDQPHEKENQNSAFPSIR